MVKKDDKIFRVFAKKMEAIQWSGVSYKIFQKKIDAGEIVPIVDGTTGITFFDLRQINDAFLGSTAKGDE